MTRIFDAAIHPSLWEAGLCYCPELKLSLVKSHRRELCLYVQLLLLHSLVLLLCCQDVELL